MYHFTFRVRDQFGTALYYSMVCEVDPSLSWKDIWGERLLPDGTGMWKFKGPLEKNPSAPPQNLGD